MQKRNKKHYKHASIKNTMFGKLKEKLKSWTKRISEHKEKEEETEVVEIEKPEKEISEKIQEPKKEIPLPVKFEPGTQKYEPDLDALEKKAEKVKAELEKEKDKVKDKLKKDIEEGERKLKKIEKIISKKESKEDSQIITIKPTPKEDSSLTIPKEEIQEPEATPSPGEQGFFKKITSKINKVKVSEKEFEIYAEELEMLLLENNVALEVAEKIIKELKEKIVGAELLKKEIESEITDHLKDILRNILVEPFTLADKIKEKSQDQSKDPYVILFCGINGTGKTTTIAKIAQDLKKQGINCVIAAGDTFRAASIEQIKKHGEKLKIPVISNDYGSDPASVGFDAIKYAKKNFINCVLIDTAGRMHTSKNLLNEIEKISRVCKPDLKIFIGESITGNDAIEQVKSFDWAIGINGIILTKADIDEKGGTALSVGYVTKKPILYLGTGQDYDKIEPFDKEKFIKALGLN